MGQVNDAINTASAALTLVERIAALFGHGDPKVRARALRLRAVNRRVAAARALTERGRQRKLAAAAALEEKADVLDPPAPAEGGERGRIEPTQVLDALGQRRP